MIALLCALSYVNCHAIICLPIMYIFRETPLVNCGPRSYFPTMFTTVLIAFRTHFLAGHILFSSYFTLEHLIFCVQQAGEIDNLSVTLGQSGLFVIVCSSTSIVVNGAIDTLLSLLQVLLVRQPWFCNQGKISATLLHAFLLGSPNSS